MGQSGEIKKNIGYMSQRSPLRRLTVEENIDFFSGTTASPTRRKWSASNGSSRWRVSPASAAITHHGERFKQRLAREYAVIHEP